MSDIKEIFCSRFLGGYIIEADFSQLEVFALSFLSGDEQLKEDLRNGVDIHSVNAANLFDYNLVDFLSLIKQEAPNELWLRKIAKTLTFQLQYGAGYKTMAAQNDISEDTAKKFIKVYYDRYKGVKAWHDRLLFNAKSNRKISTKHTKTGVPAGVYKMPSITGRIYTFYEQDGFRGEPSFSPTQLKNYPVQGFATGDIVPMVLGGIHKAIYEKELQHGALLINTIHDSVLLDVHNGYVHKIAQLVKTKMEEAPQLLYDNFGIDFDLELKAEVKVGKNWLTMEKYDDTRKY